MGLFGFGKKEKDKMKDGLEKTRTGFWGNIMNTLTGSKIDDDLYDELEEQLILADVGGEVAIKLVDKLRDRVNEKGLKTGVSRPAMNCATSLPMRCAPKLRCSWTADPPSFWSSA